MYSLKVMGAFTGELSAKLTNFTNYSKFIRILYIPHFASRIGVSDVVVDEIIGQVFVIIIIVVVMMELVILVVVVNGRWLVIRILVLVLFVGAIVVQL